MADHSANNKRIAKNTMMLYVRMLFSMLVSLYTSRVILQTLGVEDYGIYNVVGGVVSMFSMISGSLSSAISRFMTFELGRGDKQKLKTVFSTSITIQVIISFIVVVLAEIIGIWFLNNKMVIPADRLEAANWIFQFSLVTFVVGLISVPYNAAIVAHERMKAFAYIGILEVLAKLGIVFSLMVAPFDKLIFYGLLLMSLSLVIRIVYGGYCKRNFEECTYKFLIDKSLLKEMFGFAGWNFIGSSSSVVREHGGNLIINLFCGATVNAARGIASQVGYAVGGFVQNFVTAVNPQIIKLYASGKYDDVMNLVFRTARLSFYLLLIVSLPIAVNAEYILNMWLGVIPPYAHIFVQLILVFSLSECLANPLVTLMLATGRIRNYQIIVGSIQMLNFPVCYMCMLLGFAPYSIYIVGIFFSVCCEFARLFMLKRMVGLSVKAFLFKVYLNVFLVFFISTIFSFLLQKNIEVSFLSTLLVCVGTIVFTLVVIYFIGLNKDERSYLMVKVKQRLKKYD